MSLRLNHVLCESTILWVQCLQVHLTLPLRSKIILTSWVWCLHNPSHCDGRSCENIRFSSLFAAGDVSRGGMTTMDEHGIKSERIRRLKNSRSGFEGVVSKKRVELLTLMKDTGNVQQVRKKMLELESSWGILIVHTINITPNSWMKLTSWIPTSISLQFSAWFQKRLEKWING